MSILVLANVDASRRSREEQLLATARNVSALIDQRLTRAMALSDAVATSDSLTGGDWAGAKLRASRLSGPKNWMLLTDLHGRQIFNTNPEVKPPARPAYPLPANIQLAQDTGRGQVSNVFFGTGAHRYLVAIDSPVTARNQSYTLSYAIGTEQFLEDFAKAPTPNVTLITMVDRQRRVVARSRAHERFVGAEATAEMQRAMASRHEGIQTARSLEGEPSVVAYTRSPLTGWTTMVVQPRSTFLAPLWSSLLWIGLVSLLAAIGSAIAAHFFLRTITRELALLEADAVAVGHGDKVAPRQGLIENFGRVQAALSEASAELRVRGERQRLMINELNHRVKNTLATVQSIATQTFRGDSPDARVKFDQRLSALAYGNDLLTARNWEQVELAEIVQRCARLHEDRIKAEGPAVTLQPQAALALCMCVHELMTNSAKYGALSNAVGEVDVSWSLCPEAEQLQLIWRETGGPHVSAPTQSGFGTRLVDRLMRHELSGSVERRFEPEGLVFIARIGLAAASRWRNDFDIGAESSAERT